MDEIKNKIISFDIHDTLLKFKFENKITKNKHLSSIFYFFGNFKIFIFIYTFLCKRNEAVIKEMENLKNNNKIIILTSTNKNSEKIIKYFLKKNNITSFDSIILRKKFENEIGYKLKEIEKNNIYLHYDNNISVCNEINKLPNRNAIII